MPQIRLTDVPREILEAVNDVAEANEESTSDVVVRCIATRYSIDDSRFGKRRWGGGCGGPHMTVDVPDEVLDVLRREGNASTGKTLRGVALNSVAMFLDLTPVDEARRPR